MTPPRVAGGFEPPACSVSYCGWSAAWGVAWAALAGRGSLAGAQPWPWPRGPAGRLGGLGGVVVFCGFKDKVLESTKLLLLPICYCYNCTYYIFYSKNCNNNILQLLIKVINV